MSEDKNQEMLEQLQAAEEKEAQKASGKASRKKKEKHVKNSDGHVLTEAEIKRQAAFDEKEKKLLAQGYKREDILISIVTANFAGILLTLPFIAAVAAGYILRNGLPNIGEIMRTNPVLYFAGLFGIILGTIPLVILHEKIHGWFWSIGAENGSKDIEFGFQKENLTPYCTCASPLSKPIYILGSMMPMYCFRPVNVFFYFISEVFDVKGLGQLAFGIGTIVYAWIKIGIPVTPLIILKLIVFLLTASLFMIALMNFAAATCFWIKGSGYVMVIMFRFKDFAKYPSSIFEGIFKIIFTFIIPIAFIAYYPSLVILTPDNVPLLSWISPLYGLVFVFLSYKFWMLGVRKYDFTGS